MFFIQIAGIAIAVQGFVAALCALAVFLEKKFPGEAYDERQKLSRGRAYRLSAGVGYLYFAIAAIFLLRQVEGEKTIEPYLLVFAGLMLQVMVDHTYCLMTHSALPLTQNRTWVIVSCLFSGTIYGGMFFMDMDRYGLSFVGYGTSAWLYLMMSICALYLALMHIIQLILERKE